MEVIALNDKLEELYPLEIDVDFEVGDSSASNDFEIQTSQTGFYGIYVPGTEFGGIIEYEENPTKDAVNILRGFSWRGLLTKWFIEPEKGNDYRIVSGEANNILRELLSGVLGGFFYVPEIDSGLEINNYKFELHVSVLKGIMYMLSSFGYILKICARRTKPGAPVVVSCECAPAHKIEGTYDEDTGLNLTFTDNRMGINHLICWGKGELKDRQRIDLYMDANGNVSETRYFTGFEERQAVYENSSAESLEELKKGGINRLKELANGKKLQIDEVSGVNLEIGDIAVGRKNDMNLIIEKPIISKILRISGGTESIEYKVKGEG